MLNISADEKKALKGRGIIINNNGETFSARVVTENGTLNDREMTCINEAARRYGNGNIALTARMTVEIQGITYNNIEPLCRFLAAEGLETGGTGPKVRPVVACKGTVCTHGMIDTQDIAKEIHEKFYVGWHDVKLPHKFKIGVGGCPNNCIKPSLNDLGIVGTVKDGKPGYKVMLGGLWGKSHRVATPVDGVFTREELMDIIEKTLTLWKEQGKDGERFGLFLDRTGFDKFQEQLLAE